MSSTKSIKQRIKSVKNTSQITKAMEVALLDYVRKLHHKEFFDAIKSSGELFTETEAALKKAAEEFATL